jgi:hypothetical protein
VSHRTLLVVAGFLSWDSDTSHVDLEAELEALTSQAPEGEEARNGKAFCISRLGTGGTLPSSGPEQVMWLGGAGNRLPQSTPPHPSE